MQAQKQRQAEEKDAESVSVSPPKTNRKVNEIVNERLGQMEINNRYAQLAEKAIMKASAETVCFMNFPRRL